MKREFSTDINYLLGVFMDLQERWENDRNGFDWEALEAVGTEGAHAYNDGSGPSFASLALDGIPHTEFHARFLGYLLQAGFDPFHLNNAGSGREAVPVISHVDLAEAAESNPCSARMRASLMELARKRFEPLAVEAESGTPASSSPLFSALKACVESVPEELLQRIAPEMVKPRTGVTVRKNINPVEGYLSEAEMSIESERPYG